MLGLLGAAANWLLFTAIVLAVGSVTGRWVLAPRAGRAVPQATAHLLRTAGRLGAAAGVALPVALAMVFARQLVEFRDPFAPWSEEASLLLDGTPWGGTWRLAVGLSAVALIGWVLTRARPRGGWGLVTPAVLGLAVYPALSGHASATGALRPLTIPADFVHVLAAGSWVGGLAFVVLSERGWRRAEESRSSGPRSLLPALVPVFSPVALLSVGALLATGVLAAWVHLESVSALWATTYGRLLALKVGVVALVLWLGAVNWRRLTAMLGEEGGQAALRRNAATELLVAQVVLLVTAVLVHTSPTGH